MAMFTHETEVIKERLPARLARHGLTATQAESILLDRSIVSQTIPATNHSKGNSSTIARRRKWPRQLV